MATDVPILSSDLALIALTMAVDQSYYFGHDFSPCLVREPGKRTHLAVYSNGTRRIVPLVRPQTAKRCFLGAAR